VYQYEVTAAPGLTFDYWTVGTDDDNLPRYSSWVLPPDWSVTRILPVDYMNHGDFTAHGYVSTPTGLCPYLIEFQGPPIASGVFGFAHPGEPHTVEWTVTTNVGGIRSAFDFPVGLGRGPVHGPMMPPTVEVSIPLTSVGWHMISLPLEPTSKTILVDRGTEEIDPDSIFYSSYVAGNDPRDRLFRYEPGVGYWRYNPEVDVFHFWYEIDMEPPPGDPHPGPWWQGFWFLIDEPHTLTYTAYPMAPGEQERPLDITTSPQEWAWMMIGACARVPEPYDPDVTTWPMTSAVTDTMWGQSPDELPPLVWLPTADCGGPDAWDSGCIGLPLSGYVTGVGYYAVSPSESVYCGAAGMTDSLTPGEGYWLDVAGLGMWLKLYADQWP